MAASAVFIMDLKGKVIISRNYRGDVPMSSAERFSIKIVELDDYEMKPVIRDGETTFLWVRYNSLYLLAVTKHNINAAMILAFLYKLVQVFKEYFKELAEESIRDNFVIIYELLDEMMDFGYPQTTESKILQEYIMQQSHKLEVQEAPIAVTNAVSWRKEGIKYRKNEIFLDVIEKVNLLMASNGNVLHSEILGVIKMKSYLSGMPELKLGLNDKILMEAAGRPRTSNTIEMEDIKFHQCVRLARFENDRTISFIPPDGEFDCANYRLTTQVRPLIWIESRVEQRSATRLDLQIKAKANYKQQSVANNVEIRIPVPPDVLCPEYTTAIGIVRYLPHEDCILWSIKQFHGGKDFLFKSSFGLPTVRDEEDDSKKPTITAKFEIPYFTVSGIQVRYLKIIEKSGYQALPWVRYITQNGDYEVRMP